MNNTALALPLQMPSNAPDSLLPENQPRLGLTLGLPHLPEIDFFALDSWLYQCGLIEREILEPGPQQSEPLLHNPEEQAWRFLTRALMVSANLQQAARVPCFEPGEILSINPSGQTDRPWSAEVAVVLPAGFADDIPKLALQGTLQSMLAVLHRLPNTIPDDPVLKTLGQQVVEKISQILPPGKSIMTLLFGAYRQGVPFRYQGLGAYQLGWGAKAIRFDRSSADHDSRIGAALSEHKGYAANLLRLAGLPTPRHVMVDSLSDAVKAATALGWPVVVKPADCDRGEGVTIDIHDQALLSQAFDHARAQSATILVEERVPGICHRILVANGKLVIAVIRYPRSVEGNGELCLGDLIVRENAAQLNIAPWKRKLPLPWDDAAIQLARAQGYEAESVIPKGVKVRLRNIESTEWGGSPIDATESIHPDNVDLALRAAKLFHLSVCGLDLMSTDITVPWHKNGAKIIELNLAPLFLEGPRKGYQDRFINAFFENLGQIPVDFINGNGAKITEKAKRAQARRIKAKEACYLVQGSEAFDPTGAPYPLIGTTPQELVQALLMDRRVESLIVAPELTAEQLPLGLQ